MKTIDVPELSLIALVGASGSGKSTFARRAFGVHEILSSDFFRGMVSNDENDQSATADAFDSLYYVLEKRLGRGHLTVVDATNIRADDRKRLVQTARKFHCFAVAIVLNTPERVCLDRNAARPDRSFGPQVVRRHIHELKRGLRGLEREGFRYVHILDAPEEVAVRRVPLWNNRKELTGPFDIIGDLHGCADELRTLLAQLGWAVARLENADPVWGDESWTHPEGRKAIFLGDLVDRGPHVLETLRIVRNMTSAGNALTVPGNHDVKFMRWLKGKQVQIKHGLQASIDAIDPLSQEARGQVAAFLDSLISHYVLDGGKLVVAHAGLREDMQGRGSGAVREFCLFGETTGETDEFGLPVRANWAANYRGRATVVYGHTPVVEPEWLNNTVNIDTGAVFGGKLTALRYPELEFVSVPALREYATPVRPLQAPTVLERTSQQVHDDVLDLEDVTGKRMIETRDGRRITIREENSIAALEVMSRFAIDPHWLIYLPPTMSPCETSAHPEYLEYPTEAFAYFRKNAVARVVCEQKHMGSRAVVVVCRDAAIARSRFGVLDGRAGVCYTRTGRPFFASESDEREFIARVQAAITAIGLWDEFSTGWLCLDCELMPWSAKAGSLIQSQYASVGAAGIHSLTAALAAIEKSPAATAAGFAEAYRARVDHLIRYREAYRRYCWPVHSLADYRLAPFHLLACEGHVFADRSHRWHMETLHRLAAADPALIIATEFLEIELHDAASVEHGARWWEELTAQGGEGMVIKPLDFTVRGSKGLVQPALKCRGREYLRIIYGPEYTSDDQMPKLRARAVSAKRALALREFELGIEALYRFVDQQPLRRVHECVFGVLAAESEPVDPRL